MYSAVHTWYTSLTTPQWNTVWIFHLFWVVLSKCSSLNFFVYYTKNLHKLRNLPLIITEAFGTSSNNQKAIARLRNNAINYAMPVLNASADSICQPAYLQFKKSLWIYRSTPVIKKRHYVLCSLIFMYFVPLNNSWNIKLKLKEAPRSIQVLSVCKITFQT